MQALKKLSVPQMARRVQQYIPELDFSFVCEHLRAYQHFGMSEADVHSWVQFFDCFVIDERSVNSHDDLVKG